MKQKCTKCKIKREPIDFFKEPRKKNGLRSDCKFCVKITQKSWSEKNKVKIAIAKRKWLDDRPDYYKNNAVKFREQQKIYKAKPKVKKQHAEYQKKYRQENIRVKIAANLRCRLNYALKTNQKVGSAVKDLGCTVNEFKIYLESKFQEGMTWENYGYYGWHIDHIKPLSKFDLTNKEEFLKANHYTNLQPLWAIDNIRKGNKL